MHAVSHKSKFKIISPKNGQVLSLQTDRRFFLVGGGGKKLMSSQTGKERGRENLMGKQEETVFKKPVKTGCGIVKM